MSSVKRFSSLEYCTTKEKEKKYKRLVKVRFVKYDDPDEAGIVIFLICGGGIEKLLDYK